MLASEGLERWLNWKQTELVIWATSATDFFVKWRKKKSNRQFALASTARWTPPLRFLEMSDVNESEPFGKFKLLKPEFALFLTLTVSVVSVTSTWSLLHVSHQWSGCSGSGAPNTIWKAESLQIFNVKFLLEKRIETAHNYLACVLYSAFSNWEYKSSYIKSK